MGAVCLFADPIPRELRLSRAEKHGIKNAALRRVVGSPGTVAVLVIVLVVQLGLFVVLWQLVWPIVIDFAIPDARHVLFIAFPLNYLLTFGISVAPAIPFQRAFRAGVHDELQARGLEVCRRCNYRLADLPTDQGRCPECGTECAGLGEA